MADRNTLRLHDLGALRISFSEAPDSGTGTILAANVRVSTLLLGRARNIRQRALILRVLLDAFTISVG